MSKHLIEGAAYAVVVDADGREISDRKPGQVWLLTRPSANRADILFNADTWDSSGHTTTFDLIARGPSAAVEVRMEESDDPLYSLPAVGADYWGAVTVNWSDAFDLLP